MPNSSFIFLGFLLFSSSALAVAPAGLTKHRLSKKDRHPWRGHWARPHGEIKAVTLNQNALFTTTTVYIEANPTTTLPPSLPVEPKPSVPPPVHEAAVKPPPKGPPPADPAAPAKITSSTALPAEAAAQSTTTVVPGPAPAATKSDTRPPPAKSDTPPPAPPNNGGGGAMQGGFGVNENSHVKTASFGNKLGWYYAWSATPLEEMKGLEFVPMIGYQHALDAFKVEQVSGAKYALSLNEPDVKEQHGGVAIAIEKAAQMHNQWTANVPASVQIGSIAVANGGKGYWDAWKKACGPSCRIDFIPLHFYGLTSKDFIDYAKSYSGEGKPVWVTEIACRQYNKDGITRCTPDETRKMMQESIAWMKGEGSAYIKRWAWFGMWSNFEDSNGMLDAGGNANDLGKFYAGL